MSLFTRDRVWISADKQTYMQYDPGLQVFNLFVQGILAMQVSAAGLLTGAAAGIANFRNVLDGGDFTINPFQRGTSQVANITNTVTYGPDRWCFLGAASSAIQWSSVADASVQGFGTSLKFQRASANADVNTIKMGQVIESGDSIRLQGQQVTFSFWAAPGANFSAAGGLITVAIVSGTGSNQSAANMFAGTWSGFSSLLSQTQAISGAMTRYQFTATVPANATQLGVIISWVPVGTAGANDFVQLNGLQLEAGSVAGTFEHRDVQVELEICQRYFVQINEPAANVVVATGSVNASNSEQFYLALPVQMRVAPTVSVTVGTFKVNSATGGIVAATGLTGNATHTPNAIGLSATGTGTAGQGAQLQGGGGSGLIAISADL